MQQCRREYSRVDVSWPASIYTSAGFIDGRVKNVSIGGALVNCRSLPNLEETFSLTIEIPDYLFPVSAVVKKVRLNVYDSDGDETPASYDLAVQFIDMSSEDRKVFINAIEKAVRTQHIRPVKEERVRPPSNRIDNSLLVSVEKLSTSLGRSFKDLLEEALQDLISKYDKGAAEKNRSIRL
ncbi:MAG: PilZ domain-containing protein [Syntrophobacterales bacterium]